MNPANHCSICQLCAVSEQFPGSNACGDKMTDSFMRGYWHNGNGWHIMRDGRVLTKSTLSNSQEWQRAQKKNKDTQTFITVIYNQEHESILLEWKDDVAVFEDKESLEKFVFYITTHPFSLILEYRVGGILVGFNWLIKIENAVIHQLFPWKKKQFAALNLGKFAYQNIVYKWPECWHFLGYDSALKNKLGGWAYNGRVLQVAGEKINNFHVTT
jgi:hypothetical protein